MRRGELEQPATRMLRRTLAAATASLAVGALAPALAPAVAGAAGPTQAAKRPRPERAKLTRLSNEQTVTRWAHPYNEARIRTKPIKRAKVIGRMRLNTEDGFPEVYIALQSTTDRRGNVWVHIRIPGRPNGRTGWVSRDDLGDYRTVRTLLVVDREHLRATLFKRGRKVFSARVGVGKPSTPTPAGHFWIREKFRVHGNSIYGTHAIGTSAYAPTLTDWPGGGVVGLHGTNQPWLIPGRPSHGCIRLKNPDIARLYKLMPIGTPLEVR